jgi:hypothetical protein
VPSQLEEIINGANCLGDTHPPYLLSRYQERTLFLSCVLLNSLVPHHPRTSLAVVQVVTESHHATCTGIIGADSPQLAIASADSHDNLDAFGAP